MINNISRIQSRINEIKTRIADMEKVSKLEFQKELKKSMDKTETKENVDISSSEITDKTNENNVELLKSLAESNNINADLLQKISGNSEIGKKLNLKSKNALDFYKVISDNILK